MLISNKPISSNPNKGLCNPKKSKDQRKFKKSWIEK